MYLNLQIKKFAFEKKQLKKISLYYGKTFLKMGKKSFNVKLLFNQLKLFT